MICMIQFGLRVMGGKDYAQHKKVGLAKKYKKLLTLCGHIT